MINGPALIGFAAIAEAGGIHAAARRLNISQAALSRRIQTLEEHIGTPLFVRANRRLTLTAAGMRFLAKTRPHLDGLQAAIVEAREEGRSGGAMVTFGCVPSISRFLIPEVLAAFLEEHPETRIRTFDSSANQVIGHVLDRSADFGITLLGMVPAELQQEALGDDSFVLLVHHAHPLARKRQLTWGQLVGEPLVAGGGPSGNRALMESVRSHIGVDLDWRHEVQHIPTAIEWSAAGVAHTIAPRLSLGDQLPRSLRAVELVAPHISRRIGILRRVAERLDPRAEALRRAFDAALRQKLARQQKSRTRTMAQSVVVTLGAASSHGW